MGPVFYVLAILGCGEGETACEQIAVAGSSYQSADACNQATEGALMGHLDASFPVVVAQCHRADQPAAAKVWADEVDRARPDTDVAQPRIEQAAYKPAPRRKS